MEIEINYPRPISRRTFRYLSMKDASSSKNLTESEFITQTKKKTRVFDPTKFLVDFLSTNVPSCEVLPKLGFNTDEYKSYVKISIEKAKRRPITRDIEVQEIVSNQQENGSLSARLIEPLYRTGSLARRNCQSVCRSPAQTERSSQIQQQNVSSKPNKRSVVSIRKISSPILSVERKSIATSRSSLFEKKGSLTSLESRTAPEDLVFGSNVEKARIMQHYYNICEGMKYAKDLNQPPLSFIDQKKVVLEKPICFKKTLVLDLDETLIYVEKKKEFGNIEGIQARPQEHRVADLVVQLRPYAHQFLREMSEVFEIIVFTAASKRYAEKMVKILDPTEDYISHVFHREHCLKTIKGLFIKDLRVIGGRELKDMVIVDNIPHSFSFQIDNGIPIMTWEGQTNDEELRGLRKYLLEGQKYYDIRRFNRARLGLSKLALIQVDSFNNSNNEFS